MPEAFLGDHVFLAADVAESTLDNGTAIEAIFFFSLRNMRHLPIFSKNKYKKIHAIVFFCVTVYKSGIFEVEKTLSFHMKNTLLLSLLLMSLSLPAQYYYNDIIATRETNRQMQTYLANKVSTVAATGYDQRGMKATDFSEYQEVKENGKALKASSIITLNKAVIYSRFDDKARIISMTDSTSGIASTTTYTYDEAGRLSRIQNTIRDSANDFNQVETHIWTYDNAGKPARMWRLISNADLGPSDSLEIRFITDDNGNTGEEHTYRKGYETGYLYYYYDERNRLSDIVRYNNKVRKLLPDLMFEYDDNDRVIQKFTTVSNANMGSYLIWRYIYDERGLKVKEALFNNEKEMTGKIDYTYTFSK